MWRQKNQNNNKNKLLCKKIKSTFFGVYNIYINTSLENRSADLRKTRIVHKTRRLGATRHYALCSLVKRGKKRLDSCHCAMYYGGVCACVSVYINTNLWVYNGLFVSCSRYPCLNEWMLWYYSTSREETKYYQLTLNSIHFKTLFLLLSFSHVSNCLAASLFSVLLFTPIVHRAGNINDVFVFVFSQRPFVSRHEFDSRWLCVRLQEFAIFASFSSSLGSFA